MSTFEQRALRCAACEAPFEARVYASVSTERMPQAPTWVLERSFQRSACPACGVVNEVSHPVLWVDMVGGLWVHCLPEPERARYGVHEAALDEVFRTTTEPPNAPPLVGILMSRVWRRVVFGYEELREKVVCRQAGLDDALVECVKMELLLQTPLMTEDGAVGLILDAVDDEHLVFSAVFDPVKGPRHPDAGLDTVKVPRAVYGQVEVQRTGYARQQRSLFEGRYRNLLRYAFEQPPARPVAEG